MCSDDSCLESECGLRKKKPRVFRIRSSAASITALWCLRGCIIFVLRAWYIDEHRGSVSAEGKPRMAEVLPTMLEEEGTRDNAINFQTETASWLER